uniref:N-acetylgalactosaminide beta-1,3-galactosyltransferase n=1 Tax=Amphimedon queenslandica TaxID=400682 RepID=A0A1X7VJ20_AMPQE
MAAVLQFFMYFVLFFCPLCVWSGDRETSLLIIMNSISEIEAKQNDNNINEWKQEMTQFNNIQLLVPLEQFSSIHIHSLAPLMERIYSNYKDIDWFLFVRPDVKINFNNLQSFLLKHEGPKSKPYFIGYALKDDVYSIIHHFIPAGSLDYPSPEGFLMSNSAMKRVSKNIKSFKPSFTIDPSYELSLFLKYMKSPSLSDMFPTPPPPSSTGVLLTHSKRFCVAGNHGNDCVIESRDSGTYCLLPPVSKDNVFFAIKTCEKYHKERIPIQLRTWTAPAAGLRLQYYSDVADSNYRTVSIGLPNTERGHCAKLLEIFRVSFNDHEFDWLVIADDDTLIRYNIN